MNCNEARRMITSYVKKELPDKEMEQFLHHIEHCSDCMDELDTYYTVYQALDLLDSGMHHDYNFRRMLTEDLHAARFHLLMKKAAGILAAVLLLLTELLIGVSVYTGIEMRQGQEEYTLIQRALLRMNLYRKEHAGLELPAELEKETMGVPEPTLELPLQPGEVPALSEGAGSSLEMPEGASLEMPEGASPGIPKGASLEMPEEASPGTPPEAGSGASGK